MDSPGSSAEPAQSPPLWAALVALLNQQRGSNIGFVNPVLYQNAENGVNDITHGNNGSFSAGTGWDPCTGLGSPNGNQLTQLFATNRNRRRAIGTRKEVIHEHRGGGGRSRPPLTNLYPLTACSC